MTNEVQECHITQKVLLLQLFLILNFQNKIRVFERFEDALVLHTQLIERISAINTVTSTSFCRTPEL